MKKDDEYIEGDSDKSDDKGNVENSDDSNEGSRRAPTLRGIGVSRNRRNKPNSNNQGDSKDQGRKEMATAQKKTKKKAPQKAAAPG